MGREGWGGSLSSPGDESGEWAQFSTFMQTGLQTGLAAALAPGGSADGVADGGVGTCCWQTGSRPPGRRRGLELLLADGGVGSCWQTAALAPGGRRRRGHLKAVGGMGNRGVVAIENGLKRLGVD